MLIGSPPPLREAPAQQLPAVAQQPVLPVKTAVKGHMASQYLTTYAAYLTGLVIGISPLWKLGSMIG